MKRYFLAAVLLAMMVIFSTGCSRNEDYKSPSTLAKEHQTVIMECFINKDGEKLKSLFSEYIVEKYPDLDTQIEEALDFIDGEIVSYDEPFSSVLGSLEKKYYGADTRNIITDEGTEYRIAFNGFYTNDESPEEIGIYVIKVVNCTEKLPSNPKKADLDMVFAYIGDADRI